MTIETDRPGLRAARALSATAMLLGAVAVASRLLEAPGLTRLRQVVPPISAGALLAFVLLGGAVFLRSRWPHQPLARFLGACAALAVATLSALWLSGSPLGLDAGVERLLGVLPGISQEAPEVGLTVLPALILMLTSLSLLSSLLPAERWRHAPGVTCTLASFVTGVGLVAVLAELYGAPLLRPGFEEQAAAAAWVEFRTTVGGLLFGPAMLGIAWEMAWPVRLLAGPSTRARLLRAFLPYITALVLIEGFLDAGRLTELPVNPALLISLKAAALVVAATVVVAVVSGRLAGALDAAYAALRGERDLFRRICETSPAGITVVDASGMITYANARAEQVLGLERGEISRRVTGYDGTHSPEEEYPFRRVMDTGLPAYDVRHAIEHPDGRRVLLSINAAPLLDGEGRVRGMVAAVDDVTDAWLSQQALEKERTFSKAVLDTVGALVVVLDLDGRIVGFNRACEQATGYSFDEVKGRRVWDFLLVPEEVDAVRSVFAGLNSGGLPAAHENFWVARDGRRTLISWSSTALVGPDGLAERLIGTGLDVTARRRAEQAERDITAQWKDTFDAVADGVCVLDRDQRIIRSNGAMSTMFGMSEEEMVGRNCWEVVHRTDGPIPDCPLVPMMETMRRGQVEMQVRDRWYEVTVDPLLAEDGGLRGIVHVARDVTQRRQSAERIRSDAARLEHLSRRLLAVHEEERSRVARELHDEIGQALTTLKLNLQAAERLAQGEAARSCIADCIGVVDEAVRQAHDISLALRPSMLDDLGLVPALRWLADNVTRRSAMGAVLHSDPPEIRVGPDLATTCYRVAQEALTNAVRHSGARSVRIGLTVAGNTLEMTISDDGVGFDVHAARRMAAEGMSFGLLGMVERVELEGGVIEIDSQPGKGTAIKTRFPLSPDSSGRHGAG